MSPRKRDDVLAAEPEQVSEGVTVARNSLTVKLTPGGAIDFEAMRPSTRTKFESALGMTGMSGKPEGVKPSAVTINRDFIPHIWDSVATGIRFAGQMFMKWPADLTQFIQFTPEEKDKLTEPTALVIEKHIPAKWLKYQEEAALVQAVVNCTQAMITRAVGQYVATVEEKKQREGMDPRPLSPAAMPSEVAGYVDPMHYVPPVTGQSVTV